MPPIEPPPPLEDEGPGAMPFASAVVIPGSPRAISDDLVRCAADALAFYLAAKVAHWNVKGHEFACLHALFEKVGDQAREAADDLAERAVALGARVDLVLASTAEAARLPGYPSGLSDGADHAGALAAMNNQFLGHARALREEATRQGDDGTFDLVNGIARAFEKLGWMLLATTER